MFSYLRTGLPDALADSSFKAFEVIERVLSELVLVGAAIFSIPPSGVMENRGGHLSSVASVNDYGPDRIRPEVDSDDKRWHFASKVSYGA
jgi:hypothetical protein